MSFINDDIQLKPVDRQQFWRSVDGLPQREQRRLFARHIREQTPAVDPRIFAKRRSEEMREAEARRAREEKRIADLEARRRRAIRRTRVEPIRYTNPPSIKEIIDDVSAYYGLTVVEMLSRRRSKSIVRPRQVAMYLAKRMTTRSLPEIGRHIGGMDHTTVIHGVNTVQKQIDADATFAREVSELQSIIRERAER